MHLIHCILDWFCSWLCHWWVVEPSGNNLHLCDSSPRCEKYQVSMDDGFLFSIFFICWHVQIVNILKYFNIIYSDVMSINYFPGTRTKLGTFEGLFKFFKALKSHMIIYVLLKWIHEEILISHKAPIKLSKLSKERTLV